MAQWIFTTPTVREAPFAWNDLMQRYSMNRGVTIVEVAPCEYEQVRYDSYTSEIGAVNLPPNPNQQDTAFWPAERAGLHVFRGGYEHIVNDAVKACIIASNIGVDASNFVPVPGQGFGDGGFGEGGFGL